MSAFVPKRLRCSPAPLSVALPAKLQNDLKQFQRLQQDLGSVAQQRLQFDLKLRETTHTLEELKTLPEDTPVYRPDRGTSRTGKEPEGGRGPPDRRKRDPRDPTQSHGTPREWP